MVIPLTHHKNSGYTEFKVLGIYLSPAAGGGRYVALNYPFVHRIFSWCAKGIVIKNIVPDAVRVLYIARKHFRTNYKANYTTIIS